MRRALRRRARRLVAVAQSFLELRPFADARPSAERGAEGGARATGKSALSTGLVRAVSGPPLPCSDSQTALCSPAVTATASAGTTADNGRWLNAEVAQSARAVAVATGAGGGGLLDARGALLVH